MAYHYRISPVYCENCLSFIRENIPTAKLSDRQGNSITLILDTPLSRAQQAVLNQRFEECQPFSGGVAYSANIPPSPEFAQWSSLSKVFLPLLCGVLLQLLMFIPGVTLSALLGSLMGKSLALASTASLTYLVAKDWLWDGWRACYAGRSNMNTLFTISIISALLTGLLHVLVPYYNLLLSFSHAIAMPLLLAGLVNLSHWLKLYFDEKIQAKLALLRHHQARLLPDEGRIETSDGLRRVARLDVKKDMVVTLHPGEVLPVDGMILSEESDCWVQQLPFTGESEPTPKTAGELVYAGMVFISKQDNSKGPLRIKATHAAGDCEIDHLLSTVNQVDPTPEETPYGKKLDTVLQYLVPSVVILGLLASGFWGSLAYSSWQLGLANACCYGLQVFMAVCLSACPCVLALAGSLPCTIARQIAFEQGILIQSLAAFTQVQRIDRVIFDKTGTLTTPAITAMQLLDTRYEFSAALWLALQVEMCFLQDNEHPIAQALVRFAKSHLGNETLASDVRLVRREYGGLIASYQGKMIYLGNAPWLAHQGFQLATTAAGIYLADPQGVVASFALSQRLRDDTLSTLYHLQTAGLTLELSTGDSEVNSQALIQALPPDIFAEVRNQQTPQDKLARIQQLQEQGTRVAMVGDGINDAAALQQADLSFYVGWQHFQETQPADICLRPDELAGVWRFWEIAKLVRRSIYHNILWACGINSLALLCACGVFYPLLQTLVNPLIFSVVMAFSTLFVVINGLRLYQNLQVTKTFSPRLTNAQSSPLSKWPLTHVDRRSNTPENQQRLMASHNKTPAPRHSLGR